MLELNRLPTAWALAGSLLAVAALCALLIPFRDDIGLINIALILLLVPIVTSALAGWLPGLVSALAANFAFNFCFLPPRYEVTVHEPHNVGALLLFMAASSVSAALFEVARRRTQAARDRRAETEALYAVAASLIANADPVRAVDQAREQLERTLGLDSTAVYAGSSAQELRLVSGLDDPDRSAEHRAVVGQAMAGGDVLATGGSLGGKRRLVGRSTPGRPRLFVRLAVGDEVIGLLEGQGSLAGAQVSRPEWLLRAMAEQFAFGVQRLQLADEQRRADRSEAVSAFKTALLSSLSHDLRTPLASIKTSVTSLLNPRLQWSEAERVELLTGVNEETDRLTRMLTGLLDLTRIESGALEPQRDWHSLEELLQEAAQSLAQHAEGRQIRIGVAEDALGFFDYAQMRNAVVNLIENALKYTPADQPVEVAADTVPGSLTVTVRDHGPGVPRADRVRVFDKFYRSASNPAGVAGSGMGLAIVKGTVEAHGGNVVVEDAADGGAVFRLRLPQPPLPARPAESALVSAQ